MISPISKLHLLNHVQKKQLILTILNSTATKRETKNYFIKYQPRSDEDLFSSKSGQKLLPQLISPRTYDQRDNAMFHNQFYNKRERELKTKSLQKDWGTELEGEEIGLFGSEADESLPVLRISIIKIRHLQRIPIETLKGIGITILKLFKLGVSPVIVIDNHDLPVGNKHRGNGALNHSANSSIANKHSTDESVNNFKQKAQTASQDVKENLDQQYYILSDIIENSLNNSHSAFIQNNNTDNFHPLDELQNPESYGELDVNGSKTHESGSLYNKLFSNTLEQKLHYINTVPLKSMFEIDSENGIHLTAPQSIIGHLQHGDVPIIYPLGFLITESQNKMIPSDLVVENVTLNLYHHYKNSIKDGIVYDSAVPPSLLSIEKIIYIDPEGGIPSLERMTSSHVLINLKQEFAGINRELQQGFLKPLEKINHLRNLQQLNNILMQLPDSAAAIITTPQLAAIDDLPLLSEDNELLSATTSDNSSPATETSEQQTNIEISDTYKDTYSYANRFSSTSGSLPSSINGGNADDLVNSSLINQQGEAVTSFRIKNPIIYNILTDRPLISPSLPVYLRKTPLLSTTILRKGIDVKFFRSDSADEGLDLVQLDKDKIIDLAKLKELIDDSFRRSLDLESYLKRVNGKVAGLVIAGDYEGGAIMTWEEAQNFKLSQKPTQIQHTAYIPYLDKFAVKRSVQGTFSVADIVFKVMVNSLFPKELIWRSRKNNPVNKWYHERSNGSMAVDGTQWKCFWVGNRTKENKEGLLQYFEICKKIQPSWLDSK